MKKILLTILIISIYNLLYAQTLEPVQVKSTPSDKVAFLDLFDIQNVGKMHLFAPTQEPVVKGYYFKGRLISKIYHTFLPYKLAKMTFHTSSAPRAVYTIKHLDENQYIIRQPLQTTSLLTLHKWNGKRLKKIKKLAYRYTKKKKIYQLDSWLQDLNKDGRLDLVQRKLVQKPNKKARITTKIYLLQANGKYKRAPEYPIDLDSFRMKMY